MKQLFDEHTNPTHCDKRMVHDGIAPLMTLIASVQKQVIEYRQRLDAVVLADDACAGEVEHMHQTLAAMDREAAAFAAAGRTLAKSFTQWDRYMATAKGAQA